MAKSNFKCRNLAQEPAVMIVIKERKMNELVLTNQFIHSPFFILQDEQIKEGELCLCSGA
jgi:hypothetical protein